MSKGQLILPVGDPNFTGSEGVVAFISHARIIEILKADRQIRPDEEVQGIRIEAAGVNVYVKKK